jgi:glycosyltransferase involved in cell wall biosynthesis
MNPSPRCSIIMPAFNVEPFIGEAIASILQQSFFDWELIVVNDGSVDGTSQRVRECHDARIRLIEQGNAGAPAARNRGLAESRGELILFLDADDRLRPTALARLSQALAAAHDACVAYGEGVVMNEQGRVFGSEKGPVFSRRPAGDILASLLQGNVILTLGAALIRASCLKKSGGFREGLRVAQDWELWCRLAATGEFTYLGGEPVIEYRLRSGSIARTHGISIDENFRTIEAVYSHPEIRTRFSEQDLARFRRKREAAAFAFAGSECLKNRSWVPAKLFFLESIRRNPLAARETILLAAAVMQWMPCCLERRLK